MQEDKLEVVDAEDKSSRKEVDKIGLEVTGDNVLATLYGSDICAHVDFLKLEFPSGSKIKILKDCTHTTTTTTTTTTVPQSRYQRFPSCWIGFHKAPFSAGKTAQAR